MHRRVLGVAAVIASMLTASAGSGAAQAEDLTPMGPRLLQQMVLRVQMPTTLGVWNQNLYQVGRGETPAVCPQEDGSFYTLPKSKNVGFVAYQVGMNTTGSVMVYQYPNAAQARAALRILRNYRCPNSAQIPAESGLVPADNGTDFTDSTRTTLVTGNGYRDGDAAVTDSSAITQRGLAIIVTKVVRYTPGNPSLEARIDEANRLGRFVTRWHAQVLTAYDTFGVNKTAR